MEDSQGTVVARGIIPEFVATKGNARLRVTDLPPGEYRVVASLYGKADGALGRQAAAFIKPDDSEWSGNKIGLDHTVPPPWTDIEIRGNTVACWNREYTFDGGPFPSAVTIGSASILACPMRLGGRANGREIAWRKGAIEFVEKRRDVVRFGVENSFGSLALQSQVTAEFDGMIRIDLRIAATRPARLDKLYLELALKKPYATLRYIIKHPGGGFYDPNILGSIPDEWHGAFSPYVWLGNEELGLVWFTESARNWRLAKKDHAIEMTKEEDRVRLRINLVDRDFKLADPLGLTFGVQATPVKPMPDCWQNVRMSCWLEYEPSVLIEWAHPWVVKWFAFPQVADPDQAIHGSYQERMAAARKKGAKYVQYININKCSAGVPEYRYHEPEWCAGSGSMDNSDVSAFGHALMAVCPRTSWADFYLHSIKRFVEKHGVDGRSSKNLMAASAKARMRPGFVTQNLK